MLQIYNIFIDIAEVSVWANIATLSAKENSCHCIFPNIRKLVFYFLLVCEVKIITLL